MQEGAPIGGRRVDFYAVTGLVVVGFALRVNGTASSALSPDEAQFVWLASAPSLSEVWRFVVAESPHPPTNFALLHLLGGSGAELFYSRLASVLGGTLSIYASYRLGRALFGASAGIAMAVLVTFSPALIELSRVCRNYAPGFAFYLLALAALASFLRDPRARHLVRFAWAAPLAGVWHYVFSVAFLSVDIALALVLLLRRSPPRTWLHLISAHIPYVLVMGSLWIAHVARMPAKVADTHKRVYHGQLSFSPLDLAEPLLGVWEYLVRAPLFGVFFALACLGALWALLHRRFAQLAFCAIPIVVAWALALAGEIPMGPTRHSAYLFPFLFGLVVAPVPDLLQGESAFPESFRRLFSRGTDSPSPGIEPRTQWIRRLPRGATILLALVACAFVVSALRHYFAPRDYDLSVP